MRRSLFNISANFLKSNAKIKNWLGNFDVIAGHYKTKIFSKDLEFKLFILGSKGGAWAHSNLVYDQKKNSYDIQKMKIQNEAKEYVEFNHFGQVVNSGSANTNSKDNKEKKDHKDK